MGCPSRKTYIKLLVSPKITILSYLSSISTFTSLVLRRNSSPDESIIIILEHTSSNCVKLLDCHSDLPEPLLNQVPSEETSDVSPQLVNTCFICIHVHRFSSVFLPFVRRESHSNLNTVFWGSNSRGNDLCKPYTNYPPALLCTNMFIQQLVPSCMPSRWQWAWQWMSTWPRC